MKHYKGRVKLTFQLVNLRKWDTTLDRHLVLTHCLVDRGMKMEQKPDILLFYHNTTYLSPHTKAGIKDKHEQYKNTEKD